jgi:LysM repeat protein
MKDDTMNKMLYLGGGLLLLLGTGCASIQTEDAVNQQSQEIASLKADFRADLNTLAEDRQRLLNQLDVQRQETAQLRGQIRQLQDRLDLVEKQAAAGDVTYRQKLQELQRTIADESKLRATAIQSVVTEVSSVVASKTNQLQAQQQQLMKSLEEAQKAAAEAPQYEYVVQKGDTLAAISKAAGVPIESLQKANGLRKGSPVRVGMKLVIPRK